MSDEEEAELLVVGSRGRGRISSALLGSVSADVAGMARRPVAIVPEGARPVQADLDLDAMMQAAAP